MPLTPDDWNVVVVGHWNRAILTPSGIARRLFRLSADEPVEVMVAIDTVNPPLVKRDKMVVVASSSRLVIRPEDCEYQQLARAMKLAATALTELPETPLRAVGINVNFRDSESLEALQNVTTMTDLDERLSDNDFTISGRSIGRTFDWEQGKINFQVVEDTDRSYQVRFNFDLQSNSKDAHIKWLGIEVERISERVNKILDECIGIKEEGYADVNV